MTHLSPRPAARHSAIAPVILLTLVSMLPLLAHAYLGSFTRYMADDYCTAAALQRQGFWAAQQNWYLSWSGRYAFTFAVSAVEQLGAAITAYLPAIAIVAWWIALLWAIEPIARRGRIFAPALLATLIESTTLAAAPNVPQSLYWQTGMITYVLPLILLTAYAGLLLRWARLPARVKSFPVQIVFSAIISLLAGGFSETATALQLGALSIAFVGSLIWTPPPFKRRVGILLGAGILGAVFAAGLVAFAPGTRFRQSLLSTPALSLPTLAEITLDYTIGNLGFVQSAWARSPLGLSLAVLIPAWLAGWTHRDSADAKPNWRKVAIRLGLLSIVALALIFACFLSTSYALATLPPDRVLIIQQYVLVCALVCGGFLIGAALRPITPFAYRDKVVLLRPVGTALIVIMAALASIQSSRRTLDLSPTAQAHAATWSAFDHAAREAKSSGIAALHLPAPDNIAGLEVIDHDPRHWTNTCASNYYGLQVTGYPPPAVPSGAALDRLTPLDANIGDVARVLGYELSQNTLQPGQTLTVTIHWLPQAVTPQPYTVFIHLYDPARGSLAQQDTYPLGEAYATTVWAPGRSFLDTYTLTVPDEASATDAARVVLGLYDLQTLRRLPVTGRDAGLEANAWIEFGSIRILP